MSKHTLILRQTNKYHSEESVYITSGNISALMHILDALQASDINKLGLKYEITDDEKALDWVKERENDVP